MYVLTLQHAILLFFAGIFGSALNAVAGGGSFIAFPALLFTGVPPVPSNATNTLALWTGTAASSRAYWNRLDLSKRVLIPLLVASICGGLAGAYLLLKTPSRTFMHLLPWMMLAATLLFIFGKNLAGRWTPAVGREATTAAVIGAFIFELLVAVYGGYFGGGIGIVNLALFAFLGMTDIHAMNALKAVLGSVINGVATLAFVLARAIFWPQALVMIMGALLGGYFGAHYAQRLPQLWIRWTVIVVAAGMTIYFFVRVYG